MWSPRLRQAAPTGLVLALTVAGFIAAWAIGVRDARRQSTHRADIIAVQIRGRLDHAAGLLESVRLFLVGHVTAGVTTPQLTDIGRRWLNPIGLQAAGWGQRVGGSERVAYERAVGHPIRTVRRSRGVGPAARRSTYLPATLVTGAAPLDVPGVDLAGEPGVAAAIARRRTALLPTSTRLVVLRDGRTRGLFLVQAAEVVSHGVPKPGYAVLFVPGSWLLAAPPGTGAPRGPVRLEIGPTAIGDLGGATTAHSTFTAAGQRFDVVVARSSVTGAAALLPWVIAAAGLALAALTARVGVSAARRARSQREVDRIFDLSPDLIAVAGFDGRFRRVNPAYERALGYREGDMVGGSLLAVVHPDDLEGARGAFEALMGGADVVRFESRAIARDGAERWLEWNARPVPDEGVVYAAARDVTDRRLAEAEVRRAQEMVEASRDELRVLADEQAALRRVATLVARNVAPTDVFEAVSAEAGRLLAAQSTVLVRFEADGTAAIAHDLPEASLSEGARFGVEGESVTGEVLRTGRPARVDHSGPASGPIAAVARGLGVRWSVGAPIAVEGRLWGVIVLSWTGQQAPADDVEARVAQFAELVSSAIANADRRAELMASRARVQAAADDARRRVVRDLHDGAQQRLVHTVITLKLARRAVHQGDGAVDAALVEALEHAERANVELRELAHGILPSVLTSGGLRPGVNALVSRLPLPVTVDVAVDRLPAGIEASAYFVIAEALTNVVKHSGAGRAAVKAWTEDAILHLEVSDDGVGGADAGGTGLLGLADRVAAFGGRLWIDSPQGGGTVLGAVLPLG